MPARPNSTVEETSWLSGGLNTNDPTHMLSNNQTPEAQNFDPSNPEGAARRKGYTEWTDNASTVSTAGTHVSGLLGGTFADGDIAIMASEGTRLYDLGGAVVTNWPTPLSGYTITANTPVRMVMFDDFVCIFNGGNGPYKYNDSAVSALQGSGTEVNGAKGVAFHKQRLYAWGVASNLSKMYWSAAGDPEDWTTANNSGNEHIAIDDGTIINGIQSSGDVLWVSKQSANTDEEATTGKIFGVFGNTPSESTIKPVAHFAALRQEAMLNYDGVMIIASSEGVFSLSGRGIAMLSRDIQSEYLAIPDKSTICLGRYENQVWMAYPASGSNNNRVFVLDMNLGRWSKYVGNGNIRAMTTHPDGSLLTGTASGDNFIHKQVNGEHDNGTGIQFVWETPDLSFGDFSKDKVGKLFFVHAKDTGSFTITMKRYLDGELQTDSTAYDFSVAAAGNIDRVVERMVLPSGDRNSKFIRFRLENEEAGGDVLVYGWSAYADVLEPTR
jgi:hypothetical protein